MRIWVVKSGENIPFENSNIRLLRAGILAKMLSENGHEVVWWTSSVNHLSKTFYPQSSQENYSLPWGTKIVFLKSILYKRNISLKRFINHWGVARQFSKLAPVHPRPDIVFCCFPTLELSYEVVKFCKKHHIPVIIDIRDLYPDVFINFFPDFLKPIAKVIFYPMSWMTKKVMEGATSLTAISKTYLEWGQSHANRKRDGLDEIFPLAYPENEKEIIPDADFIQKFSKLANKKIVLYIGSFISSIDLETIIRTARLLEGKNREEFHFVLAGDGEDRKKLEEMAKGLNNITFTGWINSHQIAWLSKQAWVGLGAYKKNALMSLPNKIFEYMSFGLPILCCLQGETKKVIEENNCGFYYDAGNPHSLLSCLESLYSLPEKRAAMKRASLDTYKTKYCASVIYNNMIEHILKVSHKKPTY